MKAVYHAPRAMSEQKQDVLLSTYSALRFAAKDALRRESVGLARDFAQDARNLVAAFGVRYKRRRKSA